MDDLLKEVARLPSCQPRSGRLGATQPVSLVRLGPVLPRAAPVHRIASAVVYCWRLGQGESSDQFGQKVVQEYTTTLGPPEAEVAPEVDDARTLSVMRKRRRAGATESRDAFAKLAEERHNDWDLGDDTGSLQCLLEHMNRDGMGPMAFA